MIICPCRKVGALFSAACSVKEINELLSYAQCCELLHQKKGACHSAETLMRSRFSAYQLQLVDYILKSWHESTRPTELDLNDATDYLQLTVIHATADNVHFCVIGRDNDGFFKLEERSRFIWEEGECFYLDGCPTLTRFRPARNETCPCGTKKKYKKCCG